MSALDGSLARLGLKTIDLYYVHYPLPLIDVGVFAEGLVEAVKSGKAPRSAWQISMRTRCAASPITSQGQAFRSPPIRSTTACSDEQRNKWRARSLL